MKNQLLEDNYLIIDDFIDHQRATELYAQFRTDSLAFPAEFKNDSQCPKSLGCGNYHWFLELLIEKIPLISELMQEPILPTYSYARIYAKGETLAKHRDRPACEISVTLHLGGDGTNWDIYFTKPNGEIASAQLKPGQAAVYMGCKSIHWREEFTGEHYGQVFLHYVRSRGSNWLHFFDRLAGKPAAPK